MKRLINIIIACVITITTASLQADTKTVSTVTVVLKTTVGEIHIEVYPVKAPHSSASFLKAIDSQLFDRDGSFFRIVTAANAVSSPAIEVIQGGVLDKKNSLPPVPHETTEQTGLLHKDGTVSLGRLNGSSGNGSGFFICIGDQPSLDFGGKRYADGLGFAAFGTVTKGMDIVRRIQGMKTKSANADNPYAQQILVEPVKIVKAYRQ